VAPLWHRALRQPRGNGLPECRIKAIRGLPLQRVHGVEIRIRRYADCRMTKDVPGKRSAPQFFNVDAVFEEEIEKAERALAQLIRKAEADKARLKAKTDVD
jgi:hypothetical protein